MADITGPSGLQVADNQFNNEKRNKIILWSAVGLVVVGVGVGVGVGVYLSKKSSGSSVNDTHTQAASNAGIATTVYTGVSTHDVPNQQQLRTDYGMESFAISALATSTPASVDWRTNGNIVTPIKNQAGCGSCWAFTAVEVMEAGYGFSTNSQAILSPQQIVDCDSHDYGCGGGWPTSAWSKYFGLKTAPYAVLNSVYPYVSGSTNKANGCNTGIVNNAANQKATITGVYNVATSNSYSSALEQKVMQWLGTYGPMSIIIDATGWGNYKNGIATAQSLGCSTNGANLDHAVTLVGYGPGYWIVRNHWDTWWGESGYIRLATGANTCSIFSAIDFAQVAAVNNGGAGPTTVSDSLNYYGKIQVLSQNQQIATSDNHYRLVNQPDGNIVLYGKNGANWATGTGQPGSTLKMQNDCNLVVYNSAGNPVWASGTGRPASDKLCTGAYLKVQPDGNLVIYDQNNQARWASGTSGKALNSASISDIGCFASKDITNAVQTKDPLSASMSTVQQDCATLAQNAGYSYFSIENRGQCFGLSGWTAPSPATGACNEPCLGDSSQTVCGANKYGEVYQIVSATTPGAFTVDVGGAAAFATNSTGACSTHRGLPTYCWSCEDTYANSIVCRDASTTVPIRHSAWPAFCPGAKESQNATDICTRSRSNGHTFHNQTAGW